MAGLTSVRNWRCTGVCGAGRAGRFARTGQFPGPRAMARTGHGLRRRPPAAAPPARCRSARLPAAGQSRPRRAAWATAAARVGQPSRV